MATPSRDEQIKALSKRTDGVDRRAAELMRKDSGKSRARATQEAFKQLRDEQHRTEKR